MQFPQPRETGPVGGVIRAMMERADDDEAEAVQSAAEELEVYCNLTGQECDMIDFVPQGPILCYPYFGKVIMPYSRKWSYLLCCPCTPLPGLHRHI